MASGVALAAGSSELPLTALSGVLSVPSVGRAGDRTADGDACGMEASRCKNGLETGVVTDGPQVRGRPLPLLAGGAEEESGGAGT